MNDKYDHNLVKNCPLCEIFLNPDSNIHTKLYYPELSEINTSNFIKCWRNDSNTFNDDYSFIVNFQN